MVSTRLTQQTRLLVLILTTAIMIATRALTFSDVRNEAALESQLTNAATAAVVRTPKRVFLTILYEAAGSCPENCYSLQSLLPPNIMWQNKVFNNTSHLETMDINTDVLFIARKKLSPVSTLVQWTVNHRRKGFSVGILVMADEKNTFGTSALFAFDYVLRNYYFEETAQSDAEPQVPLRALGNATCANQVSPIPEHPTPISKRNFKQHQQPWLGYHWAFLLATPSNMDSRHAPGSHWPASKRANPCAWSGSLRSDRLEMTQIMHTEFSACVLNIEKQFMDGLSAYWYSDMLSSTTFALNPSGNNPECHRLFEIMENGAIPVMLRSDFLTRTFAPVPGLVVGSWSEAVDAMKTLLKSPARLDAMQQDVLTWHSRMKECMREDLERILFAALSS
ncbi:hypothetical protein BJ741DRAFT_632159 [Chytriomyces cf. hyalinus JEL632]|nr:hypothetical protein BJ741DRAFT_632159 [Chytriomyces cf. hyalinus JEL632]